MGTIVSMRKQEVPGTVGVRHRAVDSSGLAQLVGLFAADLGRLIEYDSFQYSNPYREVCVSLGGDSRHQCSYTLRQDEVFLGEIKLTREQPLKESELQQLERCLGALTPLLIDALMPS